MTTTLFSIDVVACDEPTVVAAAKAVREKLGASIAEAQQVGPLQDWHLRRQAPSVRHPGPGCYLEMRGNRGVWAIRIEGSTSDHEVPWSSALRTLSGDFRGSAAFACGYAQGEPGTRETGFVVAFEGRIEDREAVLEAESPDEFKRLAKSWVGLSA